MSTNRIYLDFHPENQRFSTGKTIKKISGRIRKMIISNTTMNTYFSLIGLKAKQTLNLTPVTFQTVLKST